MRSFRFSFVLILAAATLALAPGAANAEFLLLFNDPATDGFDYRITDGDGNDLSDTPGIISVAIDDGTLSVVATATSKPQSGSGTAPQLVLSINLLRYANGSLEIAVTDNHFDVTESTTAQVSVAAGILEGGTSITYEFFSDPFNNEFGETTEIYASDEFYEPDFDIAFSEEGTASPVGSLTMTAFVAEGSGTKFEFNTSYTQRMTLAPASGSSPPLANFSYTPSKPKPDQTAAFTDTSVGDGINSWDWDFGDGESSSEQNPEHAFAVEGNYDVTLTVSNSGGEDDAKKTVSVQTNEPPRPCVNDLDGGVVCLRDGRFEITGTWTDFSNPPITQPVIWTPRENINAEGGFQNNPSGIQIVMRIADGCTQNGHWWIWLGGFTDAGWDITVRDTVTDAQQNYIKSRNGGVFPTTERDSTTFSCN